MNSKIYGFESGGDETSTKLQMILFNKYTTKIQQLAFKQHVFLTLGCIVGYTCWKFKTSPVIGEGTWIQTSLYILLMLMTVSVLKDIRTSRKLSRRLEDGINFDVREGIFLGFSKGADGERILNMDCDGEECRVAISYWEQLYLRAKRLETGHQIYIIRFSNGNYDIVRK